MKNAIQFRNLTKKFGSNVAIDNVSFDVPTGVVFALLGENGAGKTTSIKTMLGLEKATSGTTRVLEMDSRKKGIQIRRQIGFVPEKPALYDWMTVGEIGWFTAGFYPKGYLQSYYKLVESFDLPIKKKLATLSKGMRAKVSLSLAMAHSPQLLILDEPTSGLDTMVRRRFLESMVDVAADGRTVFLSSHQIPEVERVADIVAIMNQGKLLVCESLQQLKSRLEQWTVALADGADDLPTTSALPLDILSKQTSQRQVKLVVSNPNPDSLWQLREHPSVAEIEVHVPTLEEIFVTYIENSNSVSSANQEDISSTTHETSTQQVDG